MISEFAWLVSKIKGAGTVTKAWPEGARQTPGAR